MNGGKYNHFETNKQRYAEQYAFTRLRIEDVTSSHPYCEGFTVLT